MHLLKFASLLALLPFVLSDPVSYDPVYDNKAQPLNSVVCSDGDNGLITRYGWQTIQDIPTVYIGGAQAISGWNSPACGSCWNLTYTNAQGSSTSISLLAIDYADNGFNINKAALDKLTNGRALEVGIIDVTAEQIQGTACNVSPPQ